MKNRNCCFHVVAWRRNQQLHVYVHITLCFAEPLLISKHVRLKTAVCACGTKSRSWIIFGDSRTARPGGPHWNRPGYHLAASTQYVLDKALHHFVCELCMCTKASIDEALIRTVPFVLCWPKANWIECECAKRTHSSPLAVAPLCVIAPQWRM